MVSQLVMSLLSWTVLVLIAVTVTMTVLVMVSHYRVWVRAPSGSGIVPAHVA